jgi:LmbE family N-acetylglucosaminyl deacetylase
MIGLGIDHPQGLRILCLGAHCDDIEIGCGGTLLNMFKNFGKIEVHWVVLSSDARREEEASSANLFLEHAGGKIVKIERFRNGYFPYVEGKIKDYFEELKGIYSPDLVFTHYRDDLHQDHRTVSELTWNTFRNHLILEYEIPKYDGDFGTPNFFVPLEHAICQRKINSILASYKTQGDKHWMTRDLLLSVLRIRGMECASATKFAEAFYCRKITYDPAACQSKSRSTSERNGEL